MATNDQQKTLGEIIRSARETKTELSLRSLARKLEITPSYLSDIENDRRIPAQEVIQAISKELKLDFDELMGRAGRIHDDTERYMKRNPVIGVLFRKISNLSDEKVQQLLKQVDRLNDSDKK